jgi:diamine N-acetyltransferase
MSDLATVRLATADDHQAMCRLLDATDELHREALPRRFEKPTSPPRPLAYFEPFFRNHTSAALLAETDRVVGVVLVLQRPAPAFPVFRQLSFAVLDVIAVDPAWRRRGIGKQLVQSASVWAESRGAAWLELGVYEFNREALAFYEALGFQVASRKLKKPLGTEP